MVRAMEKFCLGYINVTGVQFFFQAEDGIRAAEVTGVQTCALPSFTRDNIGFIFPIHEKILVCCNNAQCLYAASQLKAGNRE